jgi:hypothetical protein
LEERVPGVAKTGTRAFDIARKEGCIGAGSDNNRILTGGIDTDQCDSSGFVSYGSDAADVDTRGGQTGLQMIGEDIVTDAANHPNQRIPGKSPGGARLIGALTARDHLKRFTEHRLSGSRQAFRLNHEIHVQTPDNNDYGLHRVRSIPSFFSSSA